jgi:DDE superfamily endonuclease
MPSEGQRVWGLPFLTVLAPSERFCDTHDRRHKKLTDWTRQVALQARRWLPRRTIVLVGDSAFAVLDLLATLTRQGLICITRLRLDAALYEPAAPREPGRKGRTRKKGARLPTLTQKLHDAKTDWQSLSVTGWYGNTERRLEICSDTAVWYHAGRPVLPIRWVLLRDPQGDFKPQALLCTDPNRDAHDIIGWFVRRWSVEVTFRETRDHLGVETQRQWSDQAIARTTPCLLALFSIVTLLATRLGKRARLAVSTAAWYRKQRPTFADTLAAVRREIWRTQGFPMSHSRTDRQKLTKALSDGVIHALCNAA